VALSYCVVCNWNVPKKTSKYRNLLDYHWKISDLVFYVTIWYTNTCFGIIGWNNALKYLWMRIWGMRWDKKWLFENSSLVPEWSRASWSHHLHAKLTGQPSNLQLQAGVSPTGSWSVRGKLFFLGSIERLTDWNSFFSSQVDSKKHLKQKGDEFLSSDRWQERETWVKKRKSDLWDLQNNSNNQGDRKRKQCYETSEED